MIMIVDDSPRMRAMITAYVRNIRDESEFCECRDGVEAVRTYERIRPDWVLMDIKMPNMDGLSATKTIRTQFPDARIIIVSNFDDVELRDAAHQSGAHGYVLKDRLFELQELMR